MCNVIRVVYNVFKLIYGTFHPRVLCRTHFLKFFSPMGRDEIKYPILVQHLQFTRRENLYVL